MVGAGVLRRGGSVTPRRSLGVAGVSVALALAVAMAGPVSAQPAMPWSGWGRTVSMLKKIPTAAGPDAFDRMKACRLRFQPTQSWVDDAQLRTKRGKPGDLILQVTFAAPDMPGRKQHKWKKDIVAQWYIPKSGKPTPWGAWADKIQNSDQVMWLHC